MSNIGRPPTLSCKSALNKFYALAKFANTGDANAQNVHLGLVDLNGKQRLVKFVAKGDHLSEEMKGSIEKLKTAMREWETVISGVHWERVRKLETQPEKPKTELDQIIDKLNAKERAEEPEKPSWADDPMVKDPKADGYAIGLVSDVLKGILTRTGGTLLLSEVLEEIEEGVERPKNPRPKTKPLEFDQLTKLLEANVSCTSVEKTDFGKLVAKQVKTRSSAGGFFNAIGRKIMTATHAIKAFFTGRTRQADWKDTVDSVLTKISSDTKMPLHDLPPVGEKPGSTVQFDAHAVAASCGLSGKMQLRPFWNGKNIYPNGEPSIKDIRQNPSLQDCWFLSSIASTLVTKGPEAIKRLIDLEKSPGNAVVRLGRNTYTVPLADVLVDGKRAVSDSAPWVRLLEQAAAMHQATLSDHLNEKGVRESDGGIAKMAFRSAANGLRMLAGISPTEELPVADDGGDITLLTVGRNVESNFANIHNLLYGDGTQRKAAVVLGCKGGLRGTLRSLGIGVSPGHLVSVLSTDTKNNTVTILDPYGHVRNLKAADLDNFEICALKENVSEKIGKLGAPKEPKDASVNTTSKRVENGFESVDVV